MKKRIMALTLALCMALSLLPVRVLAADGDFEIVDGTLVRYNGPGGDIELYGGGEITAIGPGAFQDCTSLTGIRLSYEVTVIGENAFAGCTNLKKVELQGGSEPTVIGAGAFQGCKRLTSIGDGYFSHYNYISGYGDMMDGWTAETVVNLEGVKSVGSNAFDGCESIQRVFVDDTLQEIGDNAFDGCISLEAFGCDEYTPSTPKYVMKNGVLYTQNALEETLVKYPPKRSAQFFALEGCGEGYYRIPDGVTALAPGAFADVDTLTGIRGPSSVATLGSGAFRNCGATTIDFSDFSADTKSKITEISADMFQGCKNLEGVSFSGADLKTIGARAFADCESLKWVSGATVETVGNEAFRGCKRLTWVPSGISRIGMAAFAGCEALTEVTLNGVKEIGSYAFSGCSELTTVTISWGQGERVIPDYMFNSCGKLKNVSISGTTEIEQGAFQGCAALTELTIPDSVKTIGFIAFSSCNQLKTVNIGTGLTSLNSSAFDGCSSLSDFSVAEGNTSYLSENGVLLNKEKNTLVKYPAGRKEPSYTIPGTVTSIGNVAFEDCTALSEVKFPDGLTSVGSHAFAGCTALTEVKLPDSVTTINWYAFKDCTALTEVKLPEGLTEIEDGMFSGCNTLSAVTLPEGVTSIGSSAFSGCGALTGITIPEGVTEIGYHAFKDCTALTDVKILSTDAVFETFVGYLVFEGCGEALKVQLYPGSTAEAYCKAHNISYTYIQTTLSEDMFTVDTATVTYTGGEIVKTITGMDGAKTLTAGTDYTVKYENNTNAGTATITITGMGNYTGTVTKNFTITAKAITEGMFTVNTDSATYTGAAIEKTVSGSYNGKTMVKETDYTVEYDDNVDVGTATITITGQGNYTGELAKTFTITKAGLGSLTITLTPGDTVYTGAAITQMVTVKQGTVTLAEGTDYTVAYTANVNVGTATVTVTGKGNYQGTVTKTFTITAKPLAADMFTVDNPTVVYTGAAISGTVTGTDGSKALALDADYTVACTDNINAGTATVTVTGKGNYQGTVTKTFTITAKPLAADMFTVDAPSVVYTGAAISGTVTGTDGSKALTLDADYTVACTDNINAGTATVTVTGKGNYQGTVTKSFAITPAAITDDLFTVDTDPAAYTGTAIEKTVSGVYNGKPMVQGTDYKVEYENNITVGTATLKIKGLGNFSGELSKQFSIMAEALAESMFTVDTASVVYTGTAMTKTVTGSAHGNSLTEGTDYKVRYESNINAGTAKIIISGAGDYGGTVTKTFLILPAALTADMFTVDTPTAVYTGAAIAETVTGKAGEKTLTENTDYTVACTDNTEAGTATITVTGIGNYEGTVTKTFTITPATVTQAMFTVNLDPEVYTGVAITKEVSGSYNGETMHEGTDYTVGYENHTNIGTATLTITGIGNYQGTLTKSFRITAGAIKEAMFTVDLSDAVYTGSAITRTVTGKDGEKALTEGTDYSVTWSDNVNAGTAKLVITGAGDYGGTVTKTFTILPAPLAELTPTLTGTAKVGQSLRAKVEGVDDKELTWTWMVGDTAVAGQTGSSYTLKSGDGGKTVTAKATAVEKGNYTGSTKDSAALTVEKKSGGSGGYWGSVGASSDDSSKGKDIQVTMGEKTSAVVTTVTAGKKGEPPVVSIKSSGAETFTKAIRQSGAEEARLDISGPEGETQFAVELPVGVLRAFADGNFQTVTLCFPAGEVSLSGETLKELSRQGKDKLRLQLTAEDKEKLALDVKLDGKDVEETSAGLKVKGKASADGEAKGVVAFLTDDKGNEQLLRTSHYEDGHILARLPGSSDIVVRNAARAFDDVPAGYWSAGDVAYVSARGLMSGVGKGKFGPETAVSRGMVVTILYRMAEEPKADAVRFSDVATGKYYSGAVAWAAEQGIVKGYKNAFRPDGDMTREELATVLYRYAEAAGTDMSEKGDLSGYADEAGVSAWAKEAMEWMVGTGLLRGVKKDQLAPKDSVTRAQMAAIIARYFETLED